VYVSMQCKNMLVHLRGGNAKEGFASNLTPGSSTNSINIPQLGKNGITLTSTLHEY